MRANGSRSSSQSYSNLLQRGAFSELLDKNSIVFLTPWLPLHICTAGTHGYNRVEIVQKEMLCIDVIAYGFVSG